MNQSFFESGGLITSRRNPLVRRIRSLSTSSGRHLDGHVLLEGTHYLQELLSLATQLKAPLQVVATPEWLDLNAKLYTLISSKIDLRLMSEDAFKAASSTVNPVGCGVLWPISELPVSNSSSSFVLALDRVQDPGNVGTLLRTALAADIDEVWLASGADPLGPKVIRSAVGAILRLPFERFGPSDASGVVQLSERLISSRDCGMQVVATMIPESSSELPLIPYWDLDWTEPTVLLLGNEASGVHPQLKLCCTHAVTLPHSPQVDSLNVASAAVPLLLERRRARMTSNAQLFG